MLSAGKAALGSMTRHRVPIGCCRGQQPRAHRAVMVVAPPRMRSGQAERLEPAAAAARVGIGEQRQARIDVGKPPAFAN